MKIINFTNWRQQNSLFPPREQYLCTHDDKGRNLAFKQLSKTRQRIKSIDNMHIAAGLPWRMGEPNPHLMPYTGPTDLIYVSYLDRKKHSGKGCMLGFFLDDYRFMTAVWDKLEKTTHDIRDYQVLIAPDFSQHLGERWTSQNKINIYRTCVVAAYWQLCGMNVIPTASWGDANSFSYCFAHLPENSVIAVCGTGHGGNIQRHHLWVEAIRELVRQKHPIKILVYGGKPCKIERLDVELVFIEDFITKRFRNGECGQK